MHLFCFLLCLILFCCRIISSFATPNRRHFGLFIYFPSECWLLCVAEKIQQTVKIDASTVEIEERGVKLRLTVVDTPGFGDSLNSTDWWVCIDI